MTPSELTRRIEDNARTIRFHNEHLGIDRTCFIVEGDIALDKSAIANYASYRIDLAGKPSERGLVAIESEGKILRWERGKVLDYCVFRPSFETEDEYQAVVTGMKQATAQWSAICGVRFAYRSDKDVDEDLRFGDVLFPVVRNKGGGNVIASAFFPDDPVERRVVWILDGYFQPGGFEPVGVLRHELGHALGFRHEHIRPEAPDFFDPEDTEHVHFLTDYDPQSVMHYLGPGVGNVQLTFTQADREGAVRVYGYPDQDYTFQAN